MFVGSVVLSPDDWWLSFVLLVPGLAVVLISHKLMVPVVAVNGGDVRAGRRAQLIVNIALPLVVILLLALSLAVAQHGA
jgi:hypothetical protein